MSNKEKFQETFGQIEASQEVLDKIEGLEVKKSGSRYMKPVIAFAMMCTLVLFGGKIAWDFVQPKEENGLAKGKIYYAAEKEEDRYIFYEIPRNEVQLKKENILVNNDKLSEEVIAAYVDENGYYCYEMRDGGSSSILVEKPEHTSILVFWYNSGNGGTSWSSLRFQGELKEEDGRIYLCFDSFEKGRDITEDFKDGVAEERIYWEAENVYDRVKATLELRVEGTLEDYTVDVWFVEE